MDPVQETSRKRCSSPLDFTPKSFPTLTQHLDPQWIEEALLATGTATLRKRRLPAEQTVWLLLGMAIMRDKPVAAVALRRRRGHDERLHSRCSSEKKSRAV